MRKLVSTLMAVTLMLVSATACAERITPSKNYVTKKVNVGSFNAISTSSSVDVIYTQSSGGQDVEIYAPDNLVDYIDVRVEGGVLKVGFKSPRIMNEVKVPARPHPYPPRIVFLIVLPLLIFPIKKGVATHHTIQ